MTFKEARDQYVNSTQAVRDAIRDNDVPKMMSSLELVQEVLDSIKRVSVYHNRIIKETFGNDSAIELMDLSPFDILEELETAVFGFITGGRSNALITFIVLGVSDYRELNTYFTEYAQYEKSGRREAWINQRYKIDCKDMKKVLMLKGLAKKIANKEGSYPLTRFIDNDFYVSFMTVVMRCLEEGEKNEL